MIDVVIICDDYKHGQKAAKLVGRHLVVDYKKGRRIEYYSDVLILRLSDGVRKLSAYDLKKDTGMLVLNDIVFNKESAGVLNGLVQAIEARKRL